LGALLGGLLDQRDVVLVLRLHRADADRLDERGADGAGGGHANPRSLVGVRARGPARGRWSPGRTWTSVLEEGVGVDLLRHEVLADEVVALGLELGRRLV